jgi:5-aminolevulinate synthase
MSQPKNAELVGKAKRDPSIYVSRGIDPAPGNSGRGLVVCAAASAAIRHLKSSDHERVRQHENTARLKRLIVDATLPLLPTNSHIVPLMIGDSEQCQRASALLLEEHAIYIQPINYPTVPKGTERLRITPAPFHTDLQIDCLVEALVNVWDRLGLWR